MTPHVLVVGPCSECTGPTEGHPNGYRCDRTDLTYPAGWGRQPREHHPDLTIECPGIREGACEGWQDCAVDGCPLHYLHTDPEVSARALEEDGSEVQHGVEHERNDGEWRTPTGSCYLPEFVALAEAAEALDLKPCEGRVLVHHSYEGDGFTVLERVPVATPRPAVSS